MKNYFSIFHWYVRSKCFEGLEKIYHYMVEYNNIRFKEVDQYLLNLYRVKSAFQTSKEYWQKLGLNHENHPYGETPLKTLRRITYAVPITLKDTVLELGCGRGRNGFWWRTQVGAKYIGIDCTHEFIERAELTQKNMQVDGVEFLQCDFLEAPFEKASIIYFYGTGLEDEIYQGLAKKLEALKSCPRVVMVGETLTNYSDQFVDDFSFWCGFPWGFTKVYLVSKKEPSKV